MKMRKLSALALSIVIALTSISTLNVNFVVNAASTYNSLPSPDTKALTENDFTLEADNTKASSGGVTTQTITQSAEGVKLYAQANVKGNGNAYFTLDKSFTPSYTGTTVIRLKVTKSTMYLKYKPFIQGSNDAKSKWCHLNNFITDGKSSVAGGDEIVFVIDWDATSSKVYVNGTEADSLKKYLSEATVNSGVKIGFALGTATDKANANRGITVHDIDIWETSKAALSYTVKSVTPESAQVKFNMPLFNAPTITIDGSAVTATKVDDVTYTIDTSGFEAGDYTVSVTAESITALENQEATLTISGFENVKGDVKLSYFNGTLYMTKRPGASFSANIIKAEYNDNGSLKSFNIIAEKVTDSTEVITDNAGGVKTKYFIWSDDGNMKPLGEPLEIREPKYTEDYDEPIHTLSKNTDVVSADIETVAGNVYYARVYAYGEDSNHALTLSVKEGDTVTQTFPYFVSTQLSAVYLPFTATGAETSVVVTSEDGGTFYVSEPEIEKSTETYHKTKTVHI